MKNLIERVLNLLIYLLESPYPVTVHHVRDTVPGYGGMTDVAFHKMFERDKEVLRQLGIPLRRVATDSWEVELGYVVDPNEYAVADPGLTQDERAALSVAAHMVRLGGANLGLDALLKLGGVEGVDADPIGGADLGSTATDLGTLFGAVTEHRVVTFTYRDGRRTVHPYVIAHRRGHWYLVGDGGGEARVYRVDRMGDLQVSDEKGLFKKPKNFDLKKVLDLHPWEAGEGEPVEVTVRFEPDVAWMAARLLRHPEPGGDQGLEAVIPVLNTDAFVGWILTFGAQAEVISPPEMRVEVLRRVEAALEAVG